MVQYIKEISISGIFAFIAGFVLWPPRGNYWAKLFNGSGGITLIVTVLLLSILLGAIFGRITDIRVSNFIVGGVGAYIVGMVGIEMGIDPISPVHFIWYGGLLACLIGGVAASSYL